MAGEKARGTAPSPLRGGNPRRDLRTLACCCARTRIGLACRQPAMRNGRCRMHGGASTGVRTDAGREKLRVKATTHGFHSAEGQGFLALIALLQHTARLLNLTRGLPVVEIELTEADHQATPARRRGYPACKQTGCAPFCPSPRPVGIASATGAGPSPIPRRPSAITAS